MSKDLLLCPIYQNFKKNPERIAVSYEGGCLSYAELEQIVSKLVGFYKDKNVSAGDRVGILADNSILTIANLFALQRLHSTALFLNLQLTVKDWQEQLNMGCAKLVVVDTRYKEKACDFKLEVIVTDQIQEFLNKKDTLASSQAFQEPWLERTQEAAIVFTSSQTGHKKGVRLSIENFYSSAAASNCLTGLTSGDTWAASLPMYHVGGLGIVYRTMLAGATCFIPQNFSATTILQLLRANKLTHLSVVPTILEQIIDLAVENNHSATLFGSLKAAILAGAASSKMLLDKIIKYNLPILSAWGMTETTAHCTCMSLNDNSEKVATVGKPFYHTELHIIDDNGDPVSVDEVGEILVKGPTVCLGYLDSAATQLNMRSGWLSTGDLGAFDADGYLKIMGRKDDMIISGGENIHASEIESIAQTFSQGQQVAVIPISHEKWGQRPILIMQRASAADCIEEQTEEQVLDFLRQHLAKIKVPDRVIFVDELPRTAIGKVDYKKLKVLYGDGPISK